MMPILDGYQTAMEIGAYEKVANLSPTPIAAISANCTTEDKAKCIAAGMEYFIGMIYATLSYLMIEQFYRETFLCETAISMFG